jgi:hypothetical protein
MILTDSAFDMPGKYLKTDMLWSFHNLKEWQISPIKFKILKFKHSVLIFKLDMGT